MHYNVNITNTPYSKLFLYILPKNPFCLLLEASNFFFNGKDLCTTDDSLNLKFQ